MLRDVEDERSVIAEITPDTYAALRAEGAISAGMLPKIDGALRAVALGGRAQGAQRQRGAIHVGAAADLGAEVIKIEPEGGDQTRRLRTLQLGDAVRGDTGLGILILGEGDHFLLDLDHHGDDLVVEAAGLLGGLIAYPVAAFVLDSKVVALWFFIVAFLPNTCIGAACGAVLYKVLPIRKFAEELRK